MNVAGSPTSTTCANIWVAKGTSLGGNGVWKRRGTTAQFMAALTKVAGPEAAKAFEASLREP